MFCECLTKSLTPKADLYSPGADHEKLVRTSSCQASQIREKYKGEYKPSRKHSTCWITTWSSSSLLPSALSPLWETKIKDKHTKDNNLVSEPWTFFFVDNFFSKYYNFRVLTATIASLVLSFASRRHLFVLSSLLVRTICHHLYII